ncbi:MAG: FadR family transcriptional regulator [Xanthobacteraceae bacterium]|nr:FadR family transcriptional regulator [Xanthobacteraceae bacterium]PWB66769.1 MAG: GntR family transcriptional regulator [Bradyrhizobiaceae bacterium]
MPLTAITPRRLYRQIADQLRQLIDDGEYPVGGRLPSERELAEALGVSRPSVREALIALEVEGRIRIVVGSGIYVTERPPQPVGAETAAEGPFELLKAREIVEGAIAAEAATLARPEDIAALDDVLARMAGSEGPNSALIGLDREFHIVIAGMLGNAVLTEMVGHLFDQRINPYFAQLAGYFESPETWRQAVAEHRAVRDAIAARDGAAARAAMRTHLGNSQERFSRSFGETIPQPAGALPHAGSPAPNPRTTRTRRKHA